MTFKDGGAPQGKLKVTGPAPRGRTGTTVTFWPDPTIFDEVEFRAQTVLERLQIMAFLNRGLEIRFPDERAGREAKETFKYNGGIVDYVRHLNDAKESLFRKVGSLRAVRGRARRSRSPSSGTPATTSRSSPSPTASRTIEGGMHEEGFRKALTNVVNRYARKRNLLKEKDENLRGEDIREGLTAIISRAPGRAPVRGPDQGQARQRVDPLAGRARDQREAGRLARGEPPRGRARSSPRRSRRRARASPATHARDLTRRKNALDGAGLPGKLVDCSSPRPARVRALHRRGQLGRRLGQGRARPAHPGDPADPRQDPQRREGAHRQDPQEHRDPGAGRGDRRRRRGRVRRRRRSATTRSSCWPTPTSTAATSARCCSRSSSAR